MYNQRVGSLFIVTRRNGQFLEEVVAVWYNTDICVCRGRFCQRRPRGVWIIKPYLSIVPPINSQTRTLYETMFRPILSVIMTKVGGKGVLKKTEAVAITEEKENK